MVTKILIANRGVIIKDMMVQAGVLLGGSQQNVLWALQEIKG